MNIIFVRHGETKYGLNAEGQKLIYGPLAELTDQGKVDVIQLGHELFQRGIRPARIHTSPYTRALQTTAILQQILGISDTEEYDELRDVDVPQDLGKIVGSTPRDYYNRDPWPEGHETLKQLTERSSSALLQIVTSYSMDELHLIVSHRDTILSLLYSIEKGRAATTIEELTSIIPLERGEAVMIGDKEGVFTIQDHFTLESYRKNKEG